MTSPRAAGKLSRFLASKKGELVSSYAQIVLGCIIGGAAYPLFMTENRIAPGGLTGIATILNHLFGLPVGITSLVLNVPLFILGVRALGKRVCALHLHDNDTTCDKHLVPFTPGCNLPWDAFMAALRKCGFVGSLMLESCAPFDFDAYDNAEGAGEVLDSDEPIETYLARSYEACARIAAACQGGVRGQVSDIGVAAKQ